jgi:EAL domain-containing protein (putative c-di-GMP-specific phosphodiesterase class I)
MEQIDQFSDIMSRQLIETVFQPVADLKNGRIIGYEAFSRGPKDTPYYLPVALISEAKRTKRMNELDGNLFRAAIINAQKRGIKKLLFINMDPDCIFEKPALADEISKPEYEGISADQIVIEITERAEICKFDSFTNIIEGYKNQGFLICFDNIGSAEANLYTLSNIKPDFMKIDRNLIHNIQTNIKNQEDLRMELRIAQLVGASVIAEGVETRGELEMLMKLGVPSAQGNIIGEPGRYFTGMSEAAAEIIDHMRKSEENRG